MKKRSILMISKHDLFKYGVRSMLDTSFERDRKFIIEELDDFEGITKMIFTADIDVVIVDLMCDPEKMGEDLELAMNKHPKTKFIVMTTTGNWEVLRSVFDMEVSAMVGSEVTAMELKQVIRKVLSGDKYYSQSLTDFIINKNRNIQMSKKDEELLSQLSKREKEILKLIAKEMTNREIAERLFISKRTVDTHRQNIISKLDVKNTAGLIKKALRLNLLW